MGGARYELIAGVELGGTKCVCVLGTSSGEIVDQARVPTTTPDETLAAIDTVLSGWFERPGFKRLGIASFGPINLDRLSPGWGRVLATTKPGWSYADVAAVLTRRHPVPFSIDTDVVGAALAEGRWGAAQGLRDYAYVTVGTGVGVGIIADGRPLGGFSHAELGHIRVARLPGDDWPGVCPYHGDCVEGLVAGPAIAGRTGRPAESVPVDDPVWESVAAVLAGMLQALVLTASPRLILIGGGVLTDNNALLDRLRSGLRAALGGYAVAPVLNDMTAYVRPPALGASAGPLGALAVALRADHERSSSPLSDTAIALDAP